MTLTIFATVIAAVICTAFLLVLICRSSLVSQRLKPPGHVESATFGTISVMFALFVAFGASEMTQRSRDLRLSVQKEVSLARSIFKFAEGVGPSANPVQQGLIEYLQAINSTEQAWLENPTGSESPAQASADTLVQVVTLFAVQSAASPVIKSLLISRVDEMRQARTERIALSIRSASAIPQWIGLATMAILTQLIIALAHAGKPCAMRTAVGVFTAAACAAMCYLAWIDGLIGPSKLAAAMQPLKDVLAVILSQT